MGILKVLLAACAAMFFCLLWTSFTLDVWRTFRDERGPGRLFALGYLFFCAGVPLALILLMHEGFDLMNFAL